MTIALISGTLAFVKNPSTAAQVDVFVDDAFSSKVYAEGSEIQLATKRCLTDMNGEYQSRKEIKSCFKDLLYPQRRDFILFSIIEFQTFHLEQSSASGSNENKMLHLGKTLGFLGNVIIISE